jgi:hypothetical protein
MGRVTIDKTGDKICKERVFWHSARIGIYETGSDTTSKLVVYTNLFAYEQDKLSSLRSTAYRDAGRRVAKSDLKNSVALNCKRLSKSVATPPIIRVNGYAQVPAGLRRPASR